MSEPATTDKLRKERDDATATRDAAQARACELLERARAAERERDEAREKVAQLRKALMFIRAVTAPIGDDFGDALVYRTAADALESESPQ